MADAVGDLVRHDRREKDWSRAKFGHEVQRSASWVSQVAGNWWRGWL
jgi:ribosome-binding protein aMBF1 (putative translation factor)